MRTVHTFTVTPSLPKPLEGLNILAHNMFWCWNGEFVDLFRRVDAKLWRQGGHNPVGLLGAVSQTRLEELAANEGFVYQLSQAVEKLKEKMEVESSIMMM